MAVNREVKQAKQPDENHVVKLFKEMKAEAKRITWAPKTDVKKAVAAVATFCVIYVVIIGVFDFGFNNLFKLIFK